MIGMRMGMGLGAPMSGTAAAAELAAPVITRTSPGVYTITCATAGASIYYTLDGSTPDASKTLYSAPLSIIYPQTIKAIAIKNTFSSEIATTDVTASVYTIAAAADGTGYLRIKTNANMTLTVAGGAEVKLGSGGTWGTTVGVVSGSSNKDIYFRGNDTGGLLTIPSAVNVTYLYLLGTGDSITGSINGMSMTYLYISGAGASITGSIGGMQLGTLLLNGTGASITGDISGMPLATLNLNGTGASIYGTPARIGAQLSSLKIYDETTYVYPWASQTFGGAARKWTAKTMSIDCNAQAPTVEVFDEWLKGLASVSLPGTATLTLKNTPTVDDLTAAGLIGAGSGYYAMTTTLGYTLTLGE